MIYVHVPFCRSFCTYCGFYSELACKGTDRMQDFTDRLCDEINLRRDEIDSSRNTLYIGGGTPSVLPLSLLKRIVDAIEVAVSGSGAAPKTVSTEQSMAVAGPKKDDAVQSMAVAGPKKDDTEQSMAVAGQTVIGGSWEEFTLEVNPDDIVRGGLGYAQGLRSLGVTRISMGVQSFDRELLHWMNRRHSPEDVDNAVSLLREAGFDNISLDLIFGIGDFSGQRFSDEMWADTIDRALSLYPQHISAYQLSIEEDSALEKLLERGRFTPAEDECCARQYELLCSRLSEAGFHHYEISNFALPGKEARHNSAYWCRTPYLGLGPAAHSLLHRDGDWLRCWNKSSLDDYLSLPLAELRECEILDREKILLEDLMLGLRTARGVPESLISALSSLDQAQGQNPNIRQDKDQNPCSTSDAARGIEAAFERGDLVRENGRVRIPESRFFVSDAIIESLL